MDAEDYARDHDALDLARALVDPRDAHVAQRALDREIAHVAVAAVDLQRDVADLPRVLGREQLRHRGLLRERLAAFLQHAARSVISVAASSQVAASASMLPIAWCLMIGWPNVLRSLA